MTLARKFSVELATAVFARLSNHLYTAANLRLLARNSDHALSCCGRAK